MTRRGFTKPKTSMSPAALSGLAAKRNGQSAEEAIDNTAIKLLQENKAEINKRYEPYKRVSSGAGSVFRGVYLGVSGCDYEIWLPDGRAGMLEVKSREGARIEISAVDDRQSSQLQRRMEWGQLAFVVVRLSGDWFLVPWSKWQRTDRKSHNLKQLQEIGTSLTLVDGCLSNLLEAICSVTA